MKNRGLARAVVWSLSSTRRRRAAFSSNWSSTLRKPETKKEGRSFALKKNFPGPARRPHHPRTHFRAEDELRAGPGRRCQHHGQRHDARRRRAWLHAGDALAARFERGGAQVVRKGHTPPARRRRGGEGRRPPQSARTRSADTDGVRCRMRAGLFSCILSAWLSLGFEISRE